MITSKLIVVEKYDALALVTSDKSTNVRGLWEVSLRGVEYPHPEISVLLFYPGDISVSKGDSVRVSLDAWADETTHSDGSRSWAGCEWKLRSGTKLEEGAKDALAHS